MKKLLIVFGLILLLAGNVNAGVFDGIFGGGGTGDVSTDTIWDAAGDTIYGTGNDTAARLAKGTAYQIYNMNSGATAPAWTSTLGATGTRLTKGWLPTLK